MKSCLVPTKLHDIDDNHHDVVSCPLKVLVCLYPANDMVVVMMMMMMTTGLAGDDDHRDTHLPDQGDLKPGAEGDPKAPT